MWRGRSRKGAGPADLRTWTEHFNPEGILRKRQGTRAVASQEIPVRWEGGVLHEGRSRRRRLAPFVVVCAAGVLAAACTSAGRSGTSGSGAGSTSGKSPPLASPAPLSFTPASGATGADPSKGITVRAAKGTIKSVTVTGSGLTGDRAVSGTFNSSRTSWHSNWTLPVAKTLTVNAVAAGSGGHQVTQTSTFKTLDPPQTFTTHIFEGYKQQYGVGMPLRRTFSQPIKTRAAVERSLSITTSKPVVGAWYWDNSQTLAFRPRDYWPAHTTVSFVGHLDGVKAAPGLYGMHTLTQQFSIGRSLIVVASAAKHHMKLYRDGKLFARWPISTGPPGKDTPNGTYLTIYKRNPRLMQRPASQLPVPRSAL